MYAIDLSARYLLFLASLLVPPAEATTFEYEPNHTLVGTIYSTLAHKDDSLIDIARQFELGYEEITQANPDLDPWVPGEGSRVILPKQFILPKTQYKSI